MLRLICGWTEPNPNFKTSMQCVKVNDSFIAKLLKIQRNRGEKILFQLLRKHKAQRKRAEREHNKGQGKIDETEERTGHEAQETKYHQSKTGSKR